MKVVQPQLKSDAGPFLSSGLVGLVFYLLHDLFDSRRMNTAVGNQSLDSQFGYFAPVRIEAGQDNRTGRVVDDEVDTGGQLERADVPTLAADDAALEVVARQIDDRYRRLDRMLGCATLNSLGDVVFGTVAGCFSCFGIKTLDQVRRVVPCLAFDLLQQQIFRFVGCQARHALEVVLLLSDQTLVLGS